MIEPNCDMPWEIYLDWLSDQGNDDLRQIDPNSFLFCSLGIDVDRNNENRGDGSLHILSRHDSDNSIGEWRFGPSVGYGGGDRVHDSFWGVSRGSWE